MVKKALLVLIFVASLLLNLPAANAHEEIGGDIRIAHWAAGTGGLDVYLDNELLLRDLAPQTLSEYLHVGPGAYTIALVPRGESPDAALHVVTLRVTNGHRYVIAAFAPSQRHLPLVVDETIFTQAVSGGGVANGMLLVRDGLLATRK